MRKPGFLSLTAAFLLCLSGSARYAGAGTEQGSGADRPVPADARGTCATVAAVLAVYPPLDVRRSEGPVRDFRTGAESHGCSVVVSGPASLIAADVDPAEAVRIFFLGTGWREDDRYAAGGPGTASFAFRKNGVSCQLRGGAHSWIEDGKILSSETYELEAGCAPRPD